MAKTFMITIVVDDTWEWGDDKEDDLFDAINNLLPCGCGYTNPPSGECTIHVVSMNTFKHSDEEYVDWEPVIRHMDDEENDLVVEGGTLSPMNYL